MNICSLGLPLLDVSQIAVALDANPQLWDQHRMRTESQHSPHRETNDIWVRYNAAENFTTLEEFNGPHESAWYPAAELLHVKPFVMAIFNAVGGTRLGGVLITRIPAGKRVYPHADLGWHARYYEKFAMCIRSDARQSFEFEGESLSSAPGELFWFDNGQRHEVINNSDQERITLICCIRRS